jgi:hypothetical protein
MGLIQPIQIGDREMSRGALRSSEKESYWRSHLERQSSSSESIRSYCRLRGLSEASFHFWRREIDARDRESAGRHGSGPAGLIAVDVIGETQPSLMLEIACPGGAVIRLREDVSVEVLTRVIEACRQISSEGACLAAPVRSC